MSILSTTVEGAASAQTSGLVGRQPDPNSLQHADVAPTFAIANVNARKRLHLGGKWHIIVDPYDFGFYDYRRVPYDSKNPIQDGFALDKPPTDPRELLEYNFSASPTLMVPRDWNSQDDKLFYYEGSVWYRRQFEWNENPDSRFFLHFGAANYLADVYLNGRKVGTHIGGFTPFAFEATDALRSGTNSVVVRVNNQRQKSAVPTEATDWWNYGGLTRDVFLVEVPRTFIADTRIQLAAHDSSLLRIEVKLDGSASTSSSVRVRIEELKIDAELRHVEDGNYLAQIPAGSLQRWSPQLPRLYSVEFSAGNDRLSDRVGFRTIETKGVEILLNGQPTFLRGISLHEEHPGRGSRAWSEDDARHLLSWAKELGANFVRLAHYPHNEHMARVADEIGLLLWEEIPVYWTIEWENRDTLSNARRQLAELIVRDRNRASVIVWSVANETPISEARTRFLRTLVNDARRLDGTRLVSAAMEVKKIASDPLARIVDDPFGEYTDLISFNQYVGWYDGNPEKCDQVHWEIKYNKPVFISEFGADALAGFHAEPHVRFSEEYQEDLYRRTISMLQRIPQFRGLSPWILADFRSPRRPLAHVQDGWNRKGLIGQNGERKKAFHVLQKYYQSLSE